MKTIIKGMHCRKENSELTVDLHVRSDKQFSSEESDVNMSSEDDIDQEKDTVLI